MPNESVFKERTKQAESEIAVFLKKHEQRYLLRKPQQGPAYSGMDITKLLIPKEH